MKKLVFLAPLLLASAAPGAEPRTIVYPPGMERPKMVRPHPWAIRIAQLIKPQFTSSREQATPGWSRVEALLHAMGSPPIGMSMAEDYDTPEEIGPHGISQIDWTYLAAGIGSGQADRIKQELRIDAQAILYRRSRNQPMTVGDYAVLAPRIGIARVVGTHQVERFDGMVQEVELELEKAWRGSAGTILVRLPAVPGDARRWGYLPPVGARVFIAASRPAYVARPLLNGQPPSTDQRVVFPLLPMARVDGGKLVLPKPLESFPGMPTDLVGKSIDQIDNLLAPQASRIERLLKPVYPAERLTVESIDGVPRKSPLELHFEIRREVGKQPQVWSGYDGCNWFRSFSHNGQQGRASTERGCDRDPSTDKALAAYMVTITGKDAPVFEGLDQADRYAPIAVRGNGHRITVRRLLR